MSGWRAAREVGAADLPPLLIAVYFSLTTLNTKEPKFIMIEVELSHIIIDEDKKEQMIVLKEKNGKRFIPIVVGLSEAVAIRMYLNRIKPPRPLAHDLIQSLIEALDSSLEKVVIDKLIDNTFHAKIYLKTKDEETKIIDARPSDSIAVAVRTKASLFVENGIIDRLS